MEDNVKIRICENTLIGIKIAELDESLTYRRNYDQLHTPLKAFNAFTNIVDGHGRVFIPSIVLLALQARVEQLQGRGGNCNVIQTSISSFSLRGNILSSSTRERPGRGDNTTD